MSLSDSQELVLVEIQDVNGKCWVSSEMVAEKFGRRHDHVIRDIKELLTKCSIEFATSNFGENKISILGNEEETKNYLMTKDGFTMLTMKFQNKESYVWKEKFIAAFNELEKTSVELLQKIKDNEAVIECLTLENQRLAKRLLPKEKGEKTINAPQYVHDLFGGLTISHYKKVSQAELSKESLLEAKIIAMSGQIEGLIKKIKELEQEKSRYRRM